MVDFLPLLIYLGIGGGILLLGTNAVPKMRFIHKPLAAACMTLLTVAWAAAPTMGKWVLSVWAPISVTGGWLLLDLSPEIWWATLMFGAALSGVLWVDLADRRVDLSFGGTLLLFLFTISWLTLSAGSLLMTLALWAVFDIVWVVVRLVASQEGERVVWAAAVQGISSVLLWTISLFLLRQGTSGIWWLMRPSSSSLAMLLVAALMRLGFYPFQIVNTETLSRSHPLSLMSIVNPIMGIALLYRLISLPGAGFLPRWVVAWGIVSFLWLGIRALSLRGRHALVVAGHAVLVAVITGAVVAGDGALLLLGTGTWLACMALMIVAKRFERRDFYLAWPGVIAVCFLIGAPPSPLLPLYRSLLEVSSWPLRVAALLGIGATTAALWRSTIQQAQGRVRPPRIYLLLSALFGLTLIVSMLLVAAGRADMAFGDPTSLVLWGVAMVLALSLAHWGNVVQRALENVRLLVDLLDLQWLYSAVWEGSENMLGLLRATAEVVEGSGSVLWSVLILMLVLMILGRQ
jgi:hypothetical protein